MKYFLSIGSNINATKNIEFAIKELGLILSNINKSSIYQTKSIGFEGDDFLNLVVSGDSSLNLDELNMNSEVLYYSKESFQYKIMQNFVISKALLPSPSSIYQKISWRGEKAGTEWKNQNKNIYFYENFSDIKQLVLPESNRIIDSKLYSSK